jgi:hypothetical protein
MAWYRSCVSSTAPAQFTEAEYIALERVSERKHEYVAGNIVAIAGAHPPHNLLSQHPQRVRAALPLERVRHPDE